MDDKKETLLADIQKAPLNFCTDIRSVITHSILLLGVVKPNNLMQNHDPSVAQEDLSLRDVTFIMRSLRSLLQRLQLKSKHEETTKEDIMTSP
jgi:hypothetical protein